MQQLTYDFENLSDSLTIGDIGYYIPASTANILGGFSTYTAANITAFGIVIDIKRDTIPQTVTFSWDDTDYDSDGYPDISAPSQGDYIMFGKNNVANSSSLLGYYAEVKFINNSTNKAELFSVGSEISESSK